MTTSRSENAFVRYLNENDFQDICEISKSIYKEDEHGLDYLVDYFHIWLKDSNRLMLGIEIDGHIRGFSSVFIAQSRKFVLSEGSRMHIDFRGMGQFEKLKKYYLSEIEKLIASKFQSIKSRIWMTILDDENRKMYEQFITFKMCWSVWTPVSLNSFLKSTTITTTKINEEISNLQSFFDRLKEAEKMKLIPKDLFILGARPYELSVEVLKLSQISKYLMFTPVHFYYSEGKEFAISFSTMGIYDGKKAYDLTILTNNDQLFLEHLKLHVEICEKQQGVYIDLSTTTVEQERMLSKLCKSENQSSIFSSEELVLCEAAPTLYISRRKQ